MERRADGGTDPAGWDWFDIGTMEEAVGDEINIARSFARCFDGRDGAIALQHLRKTILDRRLGPSASDAELRYLEGQRSAAAQILSMINQGRG